MAPTGVALGGRGGGGGPQPFDIDGVARGTTVADPGCDSTYCRVVMYCSKNSQQTTTSHSSFRLGKFDSSPRIESSQETPILDKLIILHLIHAWTDLAPTIWPTYRMSRGRPGWYEGLSRPDNTCCTDLVPCQAHSNIAMPIYIFHIVAMPIHVAMPICIANTPHYHPIYISTPWSPFVSTNHFERNISHLMTRSNSCHCG